MILHGQNYQKHILLQLQDFTITWKNDMYGRLWNLKLVLLLTVYSWKGKNIWAVSWQN